jgi:hypothetical protein
MGVHGQPRGRRPLDARAHLVADDEGGEKIATGPGVMLGEGPRERDDLDAGMAIGVKTQCPALSAGMLPYRHGTRRQ